jgi:hypothetical protein
VSRHFTFGIPVWFTTASPREQLGMMLELTADWRRSLEEEGHIVSAGVAASIHAALDDEMHQALLADEDAVAKPRRRAAAAEARP